MQQILELFESGSILYAEPEVLGESGGVCGCACVVSGKDFLHDGKTTTRGYSCVPKTPPVITGFYTAYFSAAEVLCKAPVCNPNLLLWRMLLFCAFA